MIIFAAGMRRAGSTVIFNIAKELVETTGGRALRLQEHNISEIIKHVYSKDAVVVKAHRFPAVPAADTSIYRVLHTVRDIREVCGSMMRIKKISFNEVVNSNILSGYISEQQTWNAFPVKYFRRYEDWVGDLRKETLSITSYLQLDVSREVCNKIADRWSIENTQKYLATVSGTHFETLFGPNHITANCTHLRNNWMTTEQLDFLTEKYRWWLEEYGYES